MKTMLSRWREILLIAWPLIVANSFWNLQLTIDRIFLGTLSTEALGAAMAVMGVFWVPMALLQQTASYVTTFVAQYYGAKENDKIGNCFWQSIYVCFIGGLLFLLLNFASRWFFGYVGHSNTMQEYEVEYFNSLTYSALPAALVAAVSGFFTGLGRTKTVIWINFVGLILNAALDYLLIFGNFGFPQLGVAGAGYATSLANLGAAIYGAFLLFNFKYQDEFNIRKSWHFNFSLIKQFLKYGLPSGLQWALEGMAFTVFLIIIGRFQNGDAALAASSIAVTIMMLTVLPSMGVAQAVLTLVGQHLGEKRADLAESVTLDGIRITFIYICTIALTFFLIPEFYISWFKNEENASLWSQVLLLGPTLLKIVAVFTIFDSVYLNISFALKGAGDTRFVSLIALTVPWPLMVLPAYLLRDHPSAVVISWWFVSLYAFSISLILFLRFKGGKWKSMSVIHPSPGV